MTTILDVARLAGVSRTTVSRVLNNQARVDEATRKRVLDTIAALNYQPSRVARNLRKQETNLIAVLIPCISNPFFGRLLQGMEDVAVKQGYNVILCNTGEDPHRELEYLRMLEKRQIDGMILTAMRNPLEEIKNFLQYGPIVLACEYTDDDSIPAVVIDNLKASEQVTEHLLMKGHTRIGYINGPDHIILCRDRQLGYIRALEKRGLPICEEFMLSEDFTIEGGYACAKRLLALEDKPTAIFAANDDMAIGAIQAVQEQGLQVPQDVAVAGFDNIQTATIVRPRLTTMDQPIFEIGVQAMELLLASLEGIQPEKKRTVLESGLCVREST